MKQMTTPQPIVGMNAAAQPAAMPFIGPATFDEAQHRIEAGIGEMECGGGTSWEDVRAELLTMSYAG